MSTLSTKKNAVIFPGTATHTSPGLPVRAYRVPQAAYREWDARVKPPKAGCERKVTTHKKATTRK